VCLCPPPAAAARLSNLNDMAANDEGGAAPATASVLKIGHVISPDGVRIGPCGPRGVGHGCTPLTYACVLAQCTGRLGTARSSSSATAGLRYRAAAEARIVTWAAPPVFMAQVHRRG
jgi:hypothetical protein